MDKYRLALQKIVKNILNKSGKEKILIVILTGVLLLVVSIPTKKDTTKETVKTDDTTCSSTDYEKILEEKLENVLSKVDGVGKVKVIITFKNTGERIIAQDENDSSENTVESDSTGGTRTTNQNNHQITNIYYDSEQGSVPYVKNENLPEVEGVVVVAQGGGDGVIVTNITGAVESLLNVPVHKIRVLKMS